MALVPVPLDGSIQDHLAPLFAVDRALQDLYRLLYDAQEVEETIQDLNVPGLPPHLYRVTEHVRRLILATEIHKRRLILQLQRNLHQHWMEHQAPPRYDWTRR